MEIDLVCCFVDGADPRHLAARSEAWQQALVSDPQTSGGLLAGVAASRAQACVLALRAAGHDAAIIGQVTEGAGLRLG